MVHASQTIRPVGWNGINFYLPERWDVIVKGNCHLIIEQKLQPLLEFRWHNKRQAPTTKNNVEFILSQLHRETEKKPQLIEPPHFLETLASHFEVNAFTVDGHTNPEGAVITCKISGTLILFQFFNTTPRSASSLISFFSTFSCSPKTELNSSWAIDDLTFLLPQRFSLDSYSFSFGLAQLYFTSKGTDLKLCRLAAASKHLERQTLKRLFASFNGTDPETCTVIDNNTLVLDSSPSFGDRLLGAVKRKKIYHWGKFCHVTDQDKILGLDMASSQPLDRNQVTLLEKNYALVQ